MQVAVEPGIRTRARPAARPALLLVGALTALGLLLRLPSFEDALYGDELSTWFIVTDGGPGRVIDLLQGNSVDLNPPLFFLVAWVTAHLGDAPQLIRLPSLLAGTAAIPLTYLLGTWTVGRRAALVGAALIALSPFLIFYTTEARAYGLVLLLVVATALALLRALDTGAFGWWAAYAACSCALIYTHYPPVFLLGVQFVWVFLTRPEARRALLAANAAAAIGYLPWLGTVLDNTGSPGAKTIGILNPFGVDAITGDLGRWAVGHPYIPLGTVPGALAIALLVAGCAVAVAGIALRLRAGQPQSRWRLPWGLGFVLLLALACPVGLALYSAVGDSVWEARNLTPSWPGLALALGALVTAPAGVLRPVAVVLVLAAFAIGGAKMLEASSQRPDYDELAQFVDSRPGVVAEVSAPSPGPLAPFGDVALPGSRDGATRQRVLRVGSAPLQDQLRARPYSPVPAPPADAVARRAALLARGGSLFLVAPGAAPLEALRNGDVTAAGAGLEATFGDGPPAALMVATLAPLRQFLSALPPDLRHVETRTFDGFMPVTVYVFRDER
ncbi:MAG: mannosyltransferase [Thermoleophilaceae bacterium]|nr:mannosyltransferase [Thermoleophilaceae bacterium]